MTNLIKVNIQLAFLFLARLMFSSPNSSWHSSLFAVYICIFPGGIKLFFKLNNGIFKRIYGRIMNNKDYFVRLI